ncbi:MAG: acetoacetate--CoA ligase [Phycicoccus sp.]
MARTTDGGSDTALPVAGSELRRFCDFVEDQGGPRLDGYHDVLSWSVADVPGFWAAAWEYFGLGSGDDYRHPLVGEAMPDVAWFEGASTNLTQWVLDRVGDGPPDRPAIVAVDEPGTVVTTSWSDLEAQVRGVAGSLRAMGVGPGDVVVGYLPTIAEAVVSALACAGLGAVWSAVGAEYSPDAVVRRFGQLAPTVLVAADGHWFGGRLHPRAEAVAQVRAGLPSIRHTVLIQRAGESVSGATVPGAASWSETVAGAPAEFAGLPFSHPLWVLFTSGTTGVPKGLVHGHGGILLEQLKQLRLQNDVTSADRVFWYTTPSWVLWNLSLCALTAGASIVCYDGAPAHPHVGRLFELAADQRVSFMGMSPGYLLACRSAGLPPARAYDLGMLRAVSSTGAPLAASLHAWAREELPGADVESTSGGTDIASSFCGAAPGIGATDGRIAAAQLGVDLQSWDEHGQPALEHEGELVITQPMPSMPLHLWGDDDARTRYRESYFSAFPEVWRHGDSVTVHEDGQVTVHGRSDATLNRLGVRLGTSEIHAVVDSDPAVADSLVVGVELPDGGYWMPLFVVLADGSVVDEELVRRLGQRLRADLSPRHVPDEVIAVPGIPRTHTGKRLELPVKRILQGRPVDEVLQTDALANPAVLEAFVAAASRHRARQRTR